ncbi:hypothetical protein HYPSUDRAFT_47062 [Hypholoma sublateritium FD-334 SS-4]|uniref:NadR/Ttd14 AAA domain-containing protein n=1 Tax=Hypholoma sublateritium (strain FD-334 SS-4) TaxID=945553 RepID=A0A0D2KQ28_HYPSF|nr:hypothetical protein HYPSUDRAFT_47062 [Hypholoma sublateritium FD-334 SS-4]
MLPKSPRKVSIYVVGPSSTGKTTLCNALAQKLGIPKTAYVTEVARQVMKDKGYSRDTIASVQMQQDIMDAYFHREEELDGLEEPIRLFDRSAMDPIVYALLTSKTQEEANARKAFLTASDHFQRVLEKYQSPESIVVLLDPVAEWLVDDGVRSLESQTECLAIFKELLKSLKVDYYEFGRHTKFLHERVTVTLGLGKF